jgi:hypothetical protein
VAALSRVEGTGTINRVPKFTAAGTISNGSIADSSSSVRLTITNNGNIGIGTGTVTSVFGTTVKVLNAGSGSTIEAGGSTVNTRLFGSEGLLLGAVGTSTSHPFTLFTGDVERMRIFANGRVGIGTGSTDAGDYRLQVAGSIYNTTGAVLAASSGNVGIRTTSPTALLDIQGTNASTDFRITRNISPDIYISISAPGNTPNRSEISINGTNVLSITVDKNVGIAQTLFGTNATNTFAISSGTGI